MCQPHSVASVRNSREYLAVLQLPSCIDSKCSLTSFASGARSKICQKLCSEVMMDSTLLCQTAVSPLSTPPMRRLSSIVIFMRRLSKDWSRNLKSLAEKGWWKAVTPGHPFPEAFSEACTEELYHKSLDACAVYSCN